MFLLAACAALFAPAGRAEDLHFFKNYFVTGNYAVEGTGLYAKGVNGWATGTITMTTSDVPQYADIVAAYLYWETVETTPKPSSMNGYFDFDSNNKPYPIVGAVVGNPNTAPCWSQGGTGGPGTWLRVYRADVLRYLKVDSTDNDVLDVDYTHTVTLPDSGINQPGIVPHTEGASLVVVYRTLDGKTPYKAVVIYDGANTMPKGSPAFAQTIGGFYQASGSGARMTQIVGNGQPGFPAKLTVNGNVPTGVPANPFIGAQGSRWDNLTFNINLALNAPSLETEVLGESNQVCLSWGAVIMSTNVVNTDGDGNLDSWKTKGLHLNVGSPATSTTPSVPATFGGCSDYPKEPCENLPAMGAVLGSSLQPPGIHKDIFVQIDWMQGNDGHIHVPKLAALQAVASAFSAHNINVHFDLGKTHYQGQPFVVPAAYAQGGNLIQESSLECPIGGEPTSDCLYNPVLPYSVLGWKTGITAVKNGFPLLSLPQYFAHDRKDIFHYILFGHALAGPTVPDPNSPYIPNTGIPVNPPPSTSGVGDLFGGDVMVTLGLWLTDDPAGCVQDDPTGVNQNICTNQTGTTLVQAGTVMHELGHNLGLRHAGGENTPNCMPDYPSIMNYLYQTRGLTDTAGNEHIDYSNGTLAALNENLLSETPSLGSLPYRIRYYGPATGLEIATGSAAKGNCNGTHPPIGTPSVRIETPGILTAATTIDWNNNGIVDKTLEAVDINYSGAVGDPVQDSVDPTLAAGAAGKRWFIDHNDWANVNLQQVGGRPNLAGLSGDVGPNDLNANDVLGRSLLGQNIIGQNIIGQNIIGQSIIGQNIIGQSIIGQNIIGQNIIGQSIIGQSIIGQSLFGEVDYDTAISTLDATGSNTPLVATVGATVPANGFNEITSTWGPPGLGQIRTYTVWRQNLDATGSGPVALTPTVGALPLLATYSYSDVITDTNPADFGASPNCISGPPCFNTHYQYFITATDANGTTSTPSNSVTAIVDHEFVTGFTGSVIYGNTLPNSMAATISGLPSGGITSANFTCPTPTPRNVGSYPDICTGPAAVGTPSTVGVTYIAGILMITPRPLTITARPYTKTYDGTTSTSPNVVPIASVGTPTSGAGLVNGDTVNPDVEIYAGPNATPVNGATLNVSSYTVNDGNNGANYAPVTKVPAAGTIYPLAITATLTAANKTYDGTNTEPNASMSCTLTGVLLADSSNVNCTATSGTFNSPQVGSATSVTATVTISGSAAGNYTLGMQGTATPSTSAMASARITPAPLSVTAAGTQAYGGTGVTFFAPVFVGFVNSETPAVLGGALVCNTNATSTSPVGNSYMTSCAGLTSTNYTITFLPGAFSVTPAPLTAIVTGTESGGPPPGFTVGTVNYSGLVSPDTSSVVTGTLSCVVSATVDAAGNYPISCSGLTAPNYNISYSYSVGPSARRTVLATDPAGNVVLFGGSDGVNSLADTWVWNGTTWAQQFPGTSPAARNLNEMVLDPALNNVVLFGGTDTIGGNPVGYSDTWTWDGMTWTQVSPTGPQTPQRYGFGMDYDGAANALVIFGGFTVNGGAMNDTWTLAGSTNSALTYTQLQPSPSPGPRCCSAMTYDPMSMSTLLFGGLQCCYADLGDTWQLTNGTWSQPTLGTSPSPRYGAAMVYDATTKKVVLFGGTSLETSSDLNDTWIWDGSNSTWTQANPLTSPPARRFDAQGMAYDAKTGTVVIFGGFAHDYSTQTDSPLGDTWSWDGSNWTQQLPITVAAPQPPTGLTAGTIAPSSVPLSWAASGSGGVVAYDIYRATTSGGYTTLLGSVGAATTTFTDTTAVSNTTYYYVVRAVVGNVESTNSNEVVVQAQ